MGQPLLAHLVDLTVQQSRDAERDETELRRRDREIGRRLADRRLDPLGLLVAWLEEVMEPPRHGRKVLAIQRATHFALAVLGLATGWGAARALFHYDGTAPVNVIGVLAVFVGLQLTLLAALGVSLLPRRLTRHVPGVGGLQDALSLLSPGRLWQAAQRFLPQEARRATAAGLARGAAHHRVFGGVEKWAVVRAAQIFAVAFNAGAVAGALYLVTFSDLAFAWSTTLELDAARMHSLTEWLAAPWSWLLPQANPSLDLVEATRYFRFKEGVLPQAGQGYPAVLGGWWPFLLAAMVCYGLLVRTALLGLASWRYRRAVTHAFLHAPGVPEVWDRLTAELVETRAPRPDEAARKPAVHRAATEAPLAEPGRPCTVVDWAAVGLSDAAVRDLLERVGSRLDSEVLRAGGANPLARDREVAAAVGRTGSPVVVLVKAWEPAMLEFLDFLADLRRAVGEDRTVVVMPVGRSPSGEPSAPVERDLAQWSDRVAEAGDPWTSVRPAPQEQGARS